MTGNTAIQILDMIALFFTLWAMFGSTNIAAKAGFAMLSVVNAIFLFKHLGVV